MKILNYLSSRIVLERNSIKYLITLYHLIVLGVRKLLEDLIKVTFYSW